MTNEQHQPSSPLFTALEPAVVAGHDDLAEQRQRPLDAVGWLSAHLAAVERVIVPAARQHEDGETTKELRRLAHVLHGELRWLEQLHSGDALVAGLDAPRQHRAVLEALDTYAEVEHRLLHLLADRLDESAQAALVAAYDKALATAPTRPHPHAPQRGLLGAIAFRVDAWRDRVLNTLDARHVPTPRRLRTPSPAGKWTGYALGGMPSETPQQESLSSGR